MSGKIRDVFSGDFEKESLISFSRDVVSASGCLVRTVDRPESEESIQHAPFTLFPSPFSKKCFDEAAALQKEIQLMVHKVAHDHEFLWDCLKNVVKVDDYTRRLWEIYDTVYKEGYHQTTCLAMIRSDYMMNISNHNENLEDRYSHLPSDVTLKQVEVNTISSSFGGIAQQLHSYHKLVVEQTFGVEHSKKVPVNSSCDCLAEGLVTAWECYGNKKAVILFLVYDVERNVYDQRLLEVCVMRQQPAAKVMRRSMIYLQNNMKMDEDRRLWVDGVEVAVVYQRSLYKPSDFVDEDSWICRLTMERSKAVLCPNAGYHLAGTKKVQQVLSGPGALERFVEDGEIRRRMSETFMGMFSLVEDEEGDQVIDMALKDPEKYVLKPQREGGGNNIYGSDVGKMLERLRGSEERSSYILMERIHPMVVKNIPVVAHSDVSPMPTLMLSEFGVFGVLVGSKKEIIINKQGGYLLRTKKIGTDEGGVATGYSVLDSPYLVD